MSAIIDAILARAAEIPEAVAFDDGESLVHYRDLARLVETVASVIRDSLGSVVPGPVAIAKGNGTNWALADLALLSLGIPCVPLPPFFSDGQKAALLKDAGAIALIERRGVTALPGLPADIPAGTAKITYTSGSTGDPRGICLSEAAMLATAQAIVARLGTGMAGVHLSVLPLPVLLENVAGLYASLLAGGTYATRRADALGLASPFRPDFPTLVGAIAGARATSLILVPELLAGLVAAMEAGGARLPLLRLVAVGGGRVPVALLARAAALGLPVIQGYGLTECGSVVSLEQIGETLRGTVGQPLDHVRLALAADGEIIVHGIGHLGIVAAPRAPGPISTGDLGTIDESGRLTIIGRKSSMLITGFARNVAPEWVEEALCAQPQIAQALVHGEGDAALSAIIVPSSLTADVGAGVAAANATLPDYAQVGPWRLSRPFTPLDGTLTANGRLRRAAILARATGAPFFDQLVARTAAARGRMLATPQLQAGLAGRIGHETYLAYLAQAYHHVRHTVPLMQLARSRLGRAPMLVEALDEYIVEESGHEHWILDDIEAAGGDPTRVVADGPSAATAAMVDHAYAAVRHGNPASFFGMVFVLEGTSIAFASQGAEAVQASLGLPPEAFRYLTSHGALDQEHMRFFESLVNRIADVEDQEAIVAMAERIFDLFGGMFAAISMPHHA